MPGTPATSPRVGAPRYANTDAADYAGQTNAVTDAFDAKVGIFLSGLASARPAAGIAERYYYATDTGELTRDTGSAWVGPLNPRSRAILTSLPASPFDGQEILLLGDATNRILWPLRYNAGSASAYKWETMGGRGLYAIASGAVSTTNTTPVALSGGPSITLPAGIGGDFDVDAEAGMFNGTAGASVTAQVFVSGVAAGSMSTLSDTTPNTVTKSNYTTVGVFGRVTSVAAAATIELRYSVGAGTGNYTGRNLRVTPIRVG